MKGIDEQYLDLLRDVMENGVEKGDRTGTGTVASFGKTITYDAHPSRFPILTTKKMFFRGVVEELLWFLRGESNIQPLVQAGVYIWVDDAYGRYRRAVVDPVSKEEFVRLVRDDDYFAAVHGDLGPVYGKKWRDFGGVDQIAQLVETLRSNPDSRRMVITAWDPPDVPTMTLPPCHYTWQVQAVPIEDGKRKLNLCFSIRSCDLLLGGPFDCISYATLLNLLAIEVGMEVGTVTMFVGDAHIYLNHLDYVKEQIGRDPNLYQYPQLLITPGKSILDGSYTSADIQLEGYQSYPNWKNVPLST